MQPVQLPAIATSPPKPVAQQTAPVPTTGLPSPMGQAVPTYPWPAYPQAQGYPMVWRTPYPMYPVQPPMMMPQPPAVTQQPKPATTTLESTSEPEASQGSTSNARSTKKPLSPEEQAKENLGRLVTNLVDKAAQSSPKLQELLQQEDVIAELDSAVSNPGMVDEARLAMRFVQESEIGQQIEQKLGGRGLLAKSKRGIVRRILTQAIPPEYHGLINEFLNASAPAEKKRPSRSQSGILA